MALALKIEHLSKTYYKGRLNFQWILNRIGANFKQDQQKNVNQYHALNDICVEIGEGEAVGITGNNGAGKTTLLKIISRITTPSSGIVKLNGGVAGILDLAAGFHPELTGRENVFQIGAFLGIPKNVLKEKMHTIIKYAELESYIDTPIKRYSAGMYLRLAFAVAVNIEREILLLDEVFAVGDKGFQEKCTQSLADMVKKNRTIIMVSHDIEHIKKICSRVLVLERGRLVNDYKV